MSRLRIQLLLDDITWSTRFKRQKNDRYSNSSTQWTLVGLKFNLGNYWIKLVYDEIDTRLADKCFSEIIIALSVNKLDHVTLFKDLFESNPEKRKK